VARAVAAVRGLGDGVLQLDLHDVHLGVREVGQAAAVVHVQVGQHDVPDVERVMAERGDLPYGGLGRGEQRLDELRPLALQHLLGLGHVVEAQPGLDQDEPGGGRLDQQRVAHRGRRRLPDRGFDLAHGAEVQVVNSHAY
jgi:hypothetical protein